MPPSAWRNSLTARTWCGGRRPGQRVGSTWLCGSRSCSCAHTRRAMPRRARARRRRSSWPPPVGKVQVGLVLLGAPGVRQPPCASDLVEADDDESVQDQGARVRDSDAMAGEVEDLGEERRSELLDSARSVAERVVGVGGALAVQGRDGSAEASSTAPGGFLWKRRQRRPTFWALRPTAAAA